MAYNNNNNNTRQGKFDKTDLYNKVDGVLSN